MRLSTLRWLAPLSLLLSVTPSARGDEAEEEARTRSEATAQMKQIMIAMHNYHDTLKSFPAPALLDADKKPTLSWRVSLLPYLEGENELYMQFHLDEPWDSPHNKPLIAKMPKVYQHPLSKVAADGKTVYAVPRGEATLFPGPEGIAIRKVTDGTSNTIAVVEVDDDHAVVWTKPDDWTLDVKNPQANLGGHFLGVFPIAAADGSIHFLRTSVDDEILRRMFTRAGREVVTIPDD